MPNKHSKNLLKPDSAVADYFETLLQEQEGRPLNESSAKVQSRVLILPGVEADLEMIDETLTEKSDAIPESDCRLIEQRSQVDDSQPLNDSDSPPSEHHQKPVAERRAGVPKVTSRQKVEFPLQCLMFRVHDHLFSIPLIELGSVLMWEHQLTRLPGMPAWLLGLIQHRHEKVKLIDTARLLSIAGVTQQATGHHVLILGNEKWGLTCDQIGEVVKLQEQDIQWSKDSHKGYTLGTIKQSLALLIDPSRILDFVTHERNSGS